MAEDTGYGVESWFGPNSMGINDAFLGQTPAFLRDNAQTVGNMQMALLQSILGNAGHDITRSANTARANAASTAQQASNQIAGNARFRGSGVGAALSQAALQAGASQEANIINQADAALFNRQANAANLSNSLVTQPLLQALGLGTNYNLGWQGLELQRSMIPTAFDKMLGAASGALGGYLATAGS